jgi:hypothetical protein
MGWQAKTKLREGIEKAYVSFLDASRQKAHIPLPSK